MFPHYFLRDRDCQVSGTFIHSGVDVRVYQSSAVRHSLHYVRLKLILKDKTYDGQSNHCMLPKVQDQGDDRWAQLGRAQTV